MPVPSPCTKVCTMDPVTGLCLGCSRTLAEIAGWGAMTEAERLHLVAALAGRRAAQRQPATAPEEG